MTCRRFLVEGRVQGVYFRQYARSAALRLELLGYARNLPDGTVEVVACGKRDRLDALAVWLSHGPSTAQVDGVSSEPIEAGPFAGFEIL